MQFYLFVRRVIVVCCLLLLSLAACAPERETVMPATRRVVAASPLPVTATRVSAEPPATAASATISATSAATATPVATSTATAAAAPADPLVIAPENAGQLTQLAQLGKGSIHSTAWSPDGLSFAVASSTGIHLYDAGTLEQLSSINSDAPVFDLFFSAAEGMLVVISETNFWPSVHLWDITTGKSLFNLVEANFVALSADDETAVTWAGSEMSSAITVSWQKLLTGEIERTLELPQPPLAYSPAAELFLDMVDSSINRQFRLINGVSGEVMRLIDAPPNVGSVAFSPQGNILAGGSEDYAVRLWDVASGELLRVLEGHTNWIGNIVFSPDGRLLATSSFQEGKVRLWNTATGELLQTLPGDGRLGFSPNGRELTVADSERVLFYDTITGQLLRTLAGYSSSVAGIAFSPDSKVLAATGGNGKMIRLWDVTSGALIQTIEGDDFLSAVAFSSDGRILAWGGGDVRYQVQLYDLKADRRLDTLVTSFTEGVFSITFSPDGRIMAATSWNGEGIFWDVDTLEQVFSQPVNFHVAFHPNGRLLAVEQNDGEGNSTVQIWDLTTWEMLRAYPIAGHIHTFNPEGLLLAAQTCCDDVGIRVGLLDMETGQFVRSIEGVGGNAALSPDGRLIAGGSGDGGSNALLLWDAGSGQRLNELEGHTNFFSVVFSPDGRLLVTVDGDGVVRLWGLEIGD